MKPVFQDKFGRVDDEDMGNCLPACIASMLECELSEVPHFHFLYPDPAQAFAEELKFLEARGYDCVYYDWENAGVLWQKAQGELAIFSGVSPRFPDCHHVLIGQITPTGWRTIHDPHPQGGDFIGPPTGVYYLFPLPSKQASVS